MRSKLPLLLTLSLLTTIICFQSVARADDTEGDEYDVDARVIRISLVSGDVTLKRHDGQDWETARLNTALVEGDTLATGSDARAEIQIDARNFVRVAPDSVIKIITLRNEGIALSLAAGTATLRLARFDKDHEYFEIDAPKTTIAAESKGVYRIEADSKGAIKLTVQDGGLARIYSDSAGFTVRAGHTATLAGDDSGDWLTSFAEAADKWDLWVNDREKYLATRLKYDQNMRYYEADIWGAEDLDAYGNWAYANDYGWIWRPNVTIINNYDGWAPYRYGQWEWCSPYGWTWVGEEPWGWAPYHYGRWVYYDNYWAWCPHSYYRPHRNWWRPALVAFLSIDLNFGSNYCWYPLSYHQRDPRSSYYQHHRDRLTPLGRNELANLRRVNPAYFRAVSTVAARDLGSHAGRPQAASNDVARRAIGAEPLRGDLPVRPAIVAGNRAGANRVARPAVPATVIAARQTGAATRTPGVPLDNELRRTRIFNGREPIATPAPTNNGGRTERGTPVINEPRPTGAVTRPPRTVDTQPARNRTLEIKRDPPSSGGADPTPVGRPEPPSRPRETRDTRSDRPAPPADSNRKAERPAGPTTDMPDRSSRPQVDRREERRVERPPAADVPDRAPRPERSERPPQRDPSPPPRSESPRSESPRAEAPRAEAPRSEAPRSAPPPAPRSEPAPQRSEPAPQRSDPPAQRSEPRSEPRAEPAGPRKP